MKVHRVLETCLYVDDLEAAQRFYQDVLGLELVSRRDGRHVFFRLDGQMLLLFDPQGSSDPEADVPPHGARGPGHIAFALSDDELPGWQRHLAERGVAIEKHVQWPQGGQSLYFRDPAGNSLELASPAIWESAGEPA